MRIRLFTSAALLALAFAASGCGSDSCNQDTDCQLPQICLLGTCMDMFLPSDGGGDVLVDLDTGQDGETPDPVEPGPDIIHETADDGPAETEGDIHEVVEEDIPQEELPPATVIWSDDFTSASGMWTTQFGTWTVTPGGEYQQSSSSAFAEAWVPAETAWTDLALEATLVADTVDSASPRAVLGVIFRVQQIDRNFYYLCGIDYNNNELILLEYNQDVPPGYQNLCSATGLTPALDTGISYGIQVVVVGSSLTCRYGLDGDAKAEISATDDTYAAGSIGLFANKASGRFDDVTVYDHRPPEWLGAEIKNPCP